MLKKAKMLVFGAAAICLSTGAFVANAQNPDGKFFRISTNNVEGNPQYDGIQKFAELVEAKSGGKIKAKVFGGTVLGKDIQVLSSMQGGFIDMAIMNTNLLVGIIKEAGLVDLPYLFENEKEAHQVLDSPVGQKIHTALDSKGLIGLAFMEMGYYHLHNSVRPINKIDDVSGLKMRVTETPVTIDTYKAFGASPVPLPYAELYNALEQRIVDGGGQPPINMVYGKIGEVSKYYSLNYYSYTPLSLLMSKKVWDKLSAEEKAIVKESAKEAKDYQREVAAKKTAECLEQLQKSTTKVNEISKEEIERFRKAVQPVVDKYSKMYNEELAKEMFAEIAKIRGK